MTPKPVHAISIDVAPGELIDKITILEIKRQRISDPEKKNNVIKELAILRDAADRAISPSQKLKNLAQELKEINETLWDIEDDIRQCERESRFDEHFIRLARSVYIHNDARARIKREINTLLGSEIIEEKSYASYV